ncbi:ATP-grasp domain-containing protein [Marinicella sp. S1101]|uniref:acetyl/propionyl/methylcrotonyl-CoA carboxylase subunit alpha n=1 Tax=Marinicella marina TaxID=2996016 RepID=UPI002260F1C7|nr:biotin carboxylase N-terminal domain-containing protein [Marinicella marina]MCX7555012.1 ATP-grasp domain-containing protein [Marinicella marina]MDJ1141324.1 biotin carboxylase N-terminal domain-containing protein [Marinicella marina]
MSIKKILIANRGEIAVRIIQTCRQLGIKTVAVFADADRNAKHVDMADESVHLGNTDLADSYLNIDKIIAAAKHTDADAVHPGYGFLSERASFATALAEEGIKFIGAPADALRLMGSKSAAKQTMIKAGVPCVPGYQEEDQDPKVLAHAASEIGFPVLIKAVAGGGGKGMKIVHEKADFLTQLDSAKREAMNAFGDDQVILEKYITKPKHIEVQVFADQHGNVVHLFERDCSTQRRYQKIIEEAPAAGLSDATRTDMLNAAIKATQAIDYEGAGTIEFIMDGDDSFYFMEMNTRLQVEHRVSELITGVDLVAWQIHVADGGKLPKKQHKIHETGHAIQVRLYAEDPQNNYLPSTGLLEQVTLHQGEHTLVDSGVRTSDSVTIHYDPMIAKLVVWAKDRKKCIQKMQEVLNKSAIFGVKTNVGFLSQILAAKAFKKHQIFTNSLDNDEIDLSMQLSPEVVAVYANHMLQQGNGTAWEMADGWRLQGTEPLKITLEYQGDEFEYLIRQEAEGYVVNEQSHCVIHADDICHVHRNQVQVVHQQLRYEFSLPDHEAQASASNANAIYAPMPGKIIDVKIAVGDPVKLGQTLVVMEAMKMELELKAERDAVIAEVPVVSGDQVIADAVLVELEAS